MKAKKKNDSSVTADDSGRGPMARRCQTPDPGRPGSSVSVSSGITPVTSNPAKAKKTTQQKIASYTYVDKMTDTQTHSSRFGRRSGSARERSIREGSSSRRADQRHPCTRLSSFPTHTPAYTPPSHTHTPVHTRSFPQTPRPGHTTPSSHTASFPPHTPGHTPSFRTHTPGHTRPLSHTHASPSHTHAGHTGQTPPSHTHAYIHASFLTHKGRPAHPHASSHTRLHTDHPSHTHSCTHASSHTHAFIHRLLPTHTPRLHTLLPSPHTGRLHHASFSPHTHQS
ncbi:hypothetical protein GWK47_040381 [Chionoecetes opilio]|uniref:Uncharacterized protein n=1 Tax=Chionoecetes opilio TaxID=41210 RepID=A0A8J4YC34_CHIOP|nr:hypothetical protein GWK47_040381 [Chionoecetes opilio]